MDIERALRATDEGQQHRTAPRAPHPTGREYEWDGTTGFIRTEPLAERPKDWDAFIRDAQLDPDEVEVIEPVQVRGWDMPQRLEDGSTGLVRAHYYRLNLRRRGARRTDLDELVKAAKRRAKAAPALTLEDRAFLVALGDLQLGKVDGDGLEGTFDRFMSATEAAVRRYRRIAKGAPIYLVHLGDCIEGFVSQGGANAWRTMLPLTEQVRLYRRMLTEQVKTLAAITPELVVVGIPGNHDEAGRPLHTYTDSWAIEAAVMVRDALELAGGYDHVKVHVPARDELTVTLDVAGTIVGMAHGHQWRRDGGIRWWADQAHGRQPIGDAHLLLSAHLHHLRVQHTGSDKLWVQVPALESGSQWWKHQRGEWGQPGVVSLMVGGGGWSSLEIL